MHPIENMLQTTMTELRQMVDVNTIVGDPVHSPSGATIIPISKVSFGFVTGGGEYGKGRYENGSTPFAAGTASGISISPVSFLVVDENHIKLLSTNSSSVVDKIIDSVPELASELKSIFDTKKSENNTDYDDFEEESFNNEYNQNEY